MSNDGKKISFSFSKVKKPTLGNKSSLEAKEKVEYVDCFDGAKGTFSYRGTPKSEPEAKKELVIPLINQKSSTDVIRCRIEDLAKRTKFESRNESIYKSDVNKFDCANSKSLEELAASEILKDLKKFPNEEKESNFVIVQSNTTANDQQNIEVEADIDYENVPVSDFGLAMLRGMGWKPGCGIGKEPRVVETVSPKLRPKGLGLGAKLAPEVTDKNKTKTKGG